MFNLSRNIPIGALALLGSTAGLPAQGIPTSQPTLITIIREEIKPGRDAEHTANEAGWPAAFEKAKSPDHYFAVTNMTGQGSEVLYLIPQQSHAAIAASMKRDEADATLSAELKRLWKADGEFVAGISTLQAMARPDLSMGAFPDMALVRFWEITTFRVRPGHERHFEEAAKVYRAAAQRSAPGTSYRVYQVIAGAPGGTYLVFSTVNSYAEFDRMMQNGIATMNGATAEETAALQAFSAQGLMSTVTNRYRLDPLMSYPDKATRDRDPEFWRPQRRVASGSGQP